MEQWGSVNWRNPKVFGRLIYNSLKHKKFELVLAFFFLLLYFMGPGNKRNLAFYILLIAGIGILLSERFRAFVAERGLIPILPFIAILIPVLIFLSEAREKDLNQKRIIDVLDEYNLVQANIIVGGSGQDKPRNALYWNNFQTNVYATNWDYLTETQSLDCARYYTNAVYNMDSANTLSALIRELQVIQPLGGPETDLSFQRTFQDLDAQLLEAASNAGGSLLRIYANCK